MRRTSACEGCSKAKSVRLRKAQAIRAARAMKAPEPSTVRAPLRGLGDLIKAILSFMGFTHCKACEARATALNRAVPFRRGRQGKNHGV